MKLKQKLESLKFKTSAVYLAFRRPDTPFYAKLMAGLTVGYALSPIDLIPDFIPFLGYLDDLLILPLLLYLTIRLIPKEIMDECSEQAKDMWKNGKPKRWYYAVPIVVIWLLILTCIVLAFL